LAAALTPVTALALDTKIEYGLMRFGVLGECNAPHECRAIVHDVRVEAIR